MEDNLVGAIYDNPQGLVWGGVADLIWIPTKIYPMFGSAFEQDIFSLNRTEPRTGNNDAAYVI
jgi:hypothetical protein